MDKKTKQAIFPWIKDWTKSYDDLRKENPNKLDFQTYFWFNPTNYKIMHYGFNVIGTILFITVAGVSFQYGWWPLTILSCVITGVFFLAILRAHKTYRAGMTFYDKHMREYPVLEDDDTVVTVTDKQGKEVQ